MEKSNWRNVVFITMLLIVSLMGICGVVSSEQTRNPGFFSSDLSLTGMDQDYDGYDETVKIEITVKNSNSWYDSSCEVSADLLLNSYVIDTNDHSFNLDNGQSATVTLYLDTLYTTTTSKATYTVEVSLVATDSYPDTNTDSDSGTIELCPFSYTDFDVELSCSVTSKGVEIGEFAQYEITISNNGGESDNIALEVLNKPPDWTKDLSTSSKNINGMSSDTITLTMTAPNSLEGTREASITLEATSQGDPTEKDTLIIRTYLDYPDLFIETDDIEFSDENPDVTEIINISAKIHNRGLQDVTNVEVAIKDGENQLGSAIKIDDLPQGSSETVFYEWETVAGFHTIEVIIDPSNKYEEFLENNNQANKSLTVNAPDLTISSSSFDFSKDVPNQGENITISVTIKNTGTSDATDVRINCYIDGIKIADEQWVSKVGKNSGTTTVDIPWIAEEGNHTIKIEIDPRNAIDEINEDNNEAQTNLKINKNPKVNFKISTSSVEVGTDVTIDASSSVDDDGKITEYYFDFGDGTNSNWVSTASVSHSFSTTGIYNITVQIKDDNGAIIESPVPKTITVTKQETFFSSTTGIIGIGVGVAIILLLAVIFLIFILKKKRKNKDDEIKTDHSEIIPPPRPPTADRNATPRPPHSLKVTPPPPYAKAAPTQPSLPPPSPQQGKQDANTKEQLKSIFDLNKSQSQKDQNVLPSTQDSTDLQNQQKQSDVDQISMCPFCGKDLNFPKTPKFCPYCREQILN